MAASNVQTYELITEVKLSIQKLHTRLDVFDQIHRQYDERLVEMREQTGSNTKQLNEHDRQIKMLENDLQKITSNLSRLTWAFVTPLIALIVTALILTAAQVAK